MRNTYIRKLSSTAMVIAVAAAALILAATRLHAQQSAAPITPAAGYDIGCSIQAESGFQDCGAPQQGHSCDVETNYASQPSRESTQISFVNRSDKPVKVFWLNFRGERILYQSLPPGGLLAQQTFVGHNWLVTSATEQCIGIFETVPQAIVDAESVSVAPPDIPVYEQPPPPAEDLVWTPGFWAWGEGFNDYYWVPGTWAAAPIVGYLWTPGYWLMRRGGFAWRAGYWSPHVGFYGGINYGGGYLGRGYAGGSWRDGRMMYNSAVTNLGTFHSNYTYSQPAGASASGTRSSYSGDAVHPNAAELAAAAEYHLPATAAQLQQLHTARSSPALRASSNNGHPSFAASSRPGEFSIPSPQAHTGTLSFTHSAPPPRPARSVASDSTHRDAPASTSAAVHPQTQLHTLPTQERATHSPTEPQPAPKQTAPPQPKPSPTPSRTATPHTEGPHPP